MESITAEVMEPTLIRLALANRRDEAGKLLARLRGVEPGYDVEDFLRAFRFDRDTESLFRQAARQIGFDAPSGSP
jgi:hypothetical protein